MPNLLFHFSCFDTLASSCEQRLVFKDELLDDGEPIDRKLKEFDLLVSELREVRDETRRRYLEIWGDLYIEEETKNAKKVVQEDRESIDHKLKELSSLLSELEELSLSLNKLKKLSEESGKEYFEIWKNPNISKEEKDVAHKRWMDITIEFLVSSFEKYDQLGAELRVLIATFPDCSHS